MPEIEFINPALFNLAVQQIQKRAFAPAPGAAPPGAAPPGGAPPGMPPGAPPPGGDPAAMGMPPGGDPAMMTAPAGGAPPVDPMAAQAPPPQPAAAPGMQPGAPAPGAAPAQQKIKPEQMMQMLDFRLYNMQQLQTAMANHMGVQIPADALILPPGSTAAPPAETALPGGEMDPSTKGPAGGQSAIKPIEAMQGAAPVPGDPAAGGGGAPPGGAPPGGAPKMASSLGEMFDFWEKEAAVEAVPSFIGRPVAAENETLSGAAALAAIFRSAAEGDRRAT